MSPWYNPAAVETCEECGRSFADAQGYDAHDCIPSSKESGRE